MPSRLAAAPRTEPAEGELPETALVLRQFRVVFNAVRAHFQRVEKQVGVGGALIWALHVIRQQPGIGVNALAEAMDIHQSTASNVLRQLVAQGLVRTEKSEQDRRSVKIHIDRAGSNLLKRVTGPYEGVLPDALRKLSPDTIAQLHRNLSDLIAVLQADEGAAQIPLADM
ncbi:MarR family winged helix-turn-helix transcriptional regulator [Hydrogenophaga sp. MI9]|uniref:MarR family winged helix-turn-helix transcriptional regulator n=1 Tax=Hydrogenophaga sp. MI9 TaxID=3453719 RepID=UPI003EED8DFD